MKCFFEFLQCIHFFNIHASSFEVELSSNNSFLIKSYFLALCYVTGCYYTKDCSHNKDNDILNIFKQSFKMVSCKLPFLMTIFVSLT